MVKDLFRSIPIVMIHSFFSLLVFLSMHNSAHATQNEVLEYQIASKSAPGRCLDVERSETQINGGKVHLWDCIHGNGSAHQLWKLVVRPNGSFQIITKGSGKALDIARKSQDNGSVAHILEARGDKQFNQLWNLLPAKGGGFHIKALHSGKCLDADISSIASNGTRVQQWTCYGPETHPNQVWELRIVEKHSQKGESEHRGQSMVGGRILLPIEEGSPHTLGRGYNSVSGAAGSECVEVANLHSIGQNDPFAEGGVRLPHGQVLYRKISIAKDSSELRSSLGIDAQASFGFFGVGVDTTTHYFNESKKYSNSLYVVIYARITNESELMNQYRLTQTGKDLLAQSPMEFYRRCGDSFIAGRTTGGEFWHVLKIETSSSSQKSDFNSKLTATGLTWSASAAIKSTLDEIKSKSRVQSQTFKKGGLGVLPDHEDLGANLSYANALAIHVQSNQSPSLISLTALPYSVVADMPILTPTLEKQRRALFQLAEASDRAWAKSQMCESIMENISAYKFELGKVAKSEISEYKRQTDAIIRQIDEKAQACFDNPKDCTALHLGWPQGKLPREKTREELIDDKNLVKVQLEFHTTNQELDHDSMLDIEIVRKSDRNHLGQWRLHEDHGKKWEDWTTNFAEIDLNRVMNDIISGNQCQLLLHMYPAGNNNWNFYIVGRLYFKDKRVETFQTDECKIEGKKSKTENRCCDPTNKVWSPL